MTVPSLRCPPRVVAVPGRAGPVGHPPAPCSLALRADAGTRGRHPRETRASRGSATVTFYWTFSRPRSSV